MPLLIPRLPAKGPNAILFFLAFPVVAFFLLRGGGLGGFGVSWTAGLSVGLQRQHRRRRAGSCVASGETTAVIGPLLWVLGKLIVLLSTLIGWVLAAADLAARPDPGFRPAGLGRPRAQPP